MLLIVVRKAEGENIPNHLNRPFGNKCTHYDIHNKLLDIMSHYMHHAKLENIRENELYPITADRYTDIESLFVCLFSLKEKFEVQEVCLD